jgi:hypothetical protein
MKGNSTPTSRKVVAFKMTDTAAKRLLAQIATDNGNVIFTDHAIAQMKRRRITRLQVINCLKRGVITESPCLDLHGLWKLTIERYASGENVGCAAAIDNSKHKSIVITAFWVKQ